MCIPGLVNLWRNKTHSELKPNSIAQRVLKLSLNASLLSNLQYSAAINQVIEENLSISLGKQLI